MSGPLYSPCGWQYETIQKTEAVFWWEGTELLKGKMWYMPRSHPKWGCTSDQDMGDGKTQCLVSFISYVNTGTQDMASEDAHQHEG